MSAIGWTSTASASTFSAMIATPSREARASLLFSMMIDHDAGALARGLRRRDPQLMDQLIEVYQYRLFRYLCHLTGSREHAEDFFQETWIRVLERGDQYNAKWKFEAWLFTIARNLVFDWQRKKKPQSLDELMSPDEDSAGWEPSTPPEESPLQRATQRQNDAFVQTVLGRLPVTFREVLVLRFQEDMSLEEIASITHAPLSTVKSRLYRGIEAFRKLLPEERA